MAKGKKTVFFCQNCGHEESKWLGQCPACKEWNTFVEERISVSSGEGKGIGPAGGRDNQPVTLKSVSTDEDKRIHTRIGELDRVLGGGIVPGSLVLVGGDPGIGKSTLLLQVCQALSGMGEADPLHFRGRVPEADPAPCQSDGGILREPVSVV